MENRFENPTLDRYKDQDNVTRDGSGVGYWIAGLLVAFALIFFFTYGTGPKTITTAFNQPSATTEKIVTTAPQPAPSAQPLKPATQPVGQ